jgi:hypothetical protein
VVTLKRISSGVSISAPWVCLEGKEPEVSSKASSSSFVVSGRAGTGGIHELWNALVLLDSPDGENWRRKHERDGYQPQTRHPTRGVVEYEAGRGRRSAREVDGRIVGIGGNQIKVDVLVREAGGVPRDVEELKRVDGVTTIWRKASRAWTIRDT